MIGRAGICFAAAGAVAAVLCPGAPAATQVADYNFNNSLASSSGTGPPLTEVGAAGPAFAPDVVGGCSKTVYSFPEGRGLNFSSSGQYMSQYSLIAQFRFASVTGYRRVLAGEVVNPDSGLYVLNGRLDLYDAGSTPRDSLGTVPINANAYTEVAVVHNGPNVQTYVNGIPDASHLGSNSGYLQAIPTLTLFKDDGSEQSAGAISHLRVFSGLLTPPEITNTPACAHVKKKCKKKKKKRQAAAAKKKKCHKKKRRRR